MTLGTRDTETSKIDQEQLNAIKILKQVKKKFRNYPNVTGIGIGYKFKNGKCLNKIISVVVFVENKGVYELEYEIPSSIALDGDPEIIVSTDIIEASFGNI